MAEYIVCKVFGQRSIKKRSFAEEIIRVRSIKPKSDMTAVEAFIDEIPPSLLRRVRC
jgi:hypothetical protein